MIPARNEERLLGACLESIRSASSGYEPQVEVIVVLNRCTDNTEAIARGFGARIVREDARNLARIRNTGARAAAGSVLITIDADSTMSPGVFAAVDRALSSGQTIGGGTRIVPQRSSLGIRVTMLLFDSFVWITQLSAGMFWCRLEDFAAIGGFNEELVSAEDLDFARRLKAYGAKQGRRFRTLADAHIVTSCRKFDAYGDWCLLTKPVLVWRLWKGRNPGAAAAFYYDFTH